MVLGKRQRSLRPHDTMHLSTCGNCPAGCGVKVFTQEGEIVDIVGDEEHPTNKGSFCPKGLLAYKHQRNPARLVQPMIRTRRDAPLQPVSWQEAMAFAAERFGAVRAEHGTDSLFVHGSTTSPLGHELGATMFARAWGTSHGPWRFHPKMLGPHGSLAHMFGVEGSRLIMNTPRDWANSQAIVVVGCDPAATDPMTIGPLVDARDRSIEVIVIDSRTTVTMQKASHALRVRPGTENIALRGILRLLFDNDWVDHAFLAEATNGTEQLRRELSDYPSDLVAHACGVPVAELQRVAEVIGTTWPLQVMTGGWLAEDRFTDDDLRLCAALAIVRGAIGVPGGGLNVLNASPFASSDWIADRPELAGPPLELAQVLIDRANNIGALVLEGDPCARLRGGRLTREQLSEIPFVVVLASYENATTAHADMVLPLASWLEHSGLIAHGNGRSLQWHQETARPPGECRSPIRIWTDLAAACGLAQGLPWGNASDIDRAAASWALKSHPWTAAITVDQLDPDTNPPGGILWPCMNAGHIAFENSRFTPRGDVRGINVLFARGRPFADSDRRFPTLDGKISIPASVSPPSVVAPDATLLLLGGIPVDHVESYSGMVTDRVAGPVLPGLWFHPSTADVVGLGDGDDVILEGEAGSMQGRVRISDLVPESVIGCIALPWMNGSDYSAWALRPVGSERDGSFYAAVRVRRAS